MGETIMTLALGGLTMKYVGDGQGEFQVGSRWEEDRTGTQEKGWARITGMAGSHVGAGCTESGSK